MTVDDRYDSTGGMTLAAPRVIFGGIVPANGFLVQNLSEKPIWVSDVGAAVATGSFRVDPGSVFVTPWGYRPKGAISVVGVSEGQEFAARMW